MISAQELRIGNWIAGSFGYEQIKPWDLTDGDLLEFSNPIPLTPEILEKCGFVSTEAIYYNIEDFHIKSMDGQGKTFMMVVGVSRIGIFIKYLHQLQNLFFCLVGRELEYNPH